jgi:hypothetical protein
MFGLKMMMKSGLDFFCSEIPLALSEIPANLPSRFSLSGQICLHWAADFSPLILGGVALMLSSKIILNICRLFWISPKCFGHFLRKILDVDQKAKLSTKESFLV